jgi:hypothetical protein
MKISSRKQLLKEADIELKKIQELTFSKPKMVKGADYEKWGDLIYDPDISQIDYEELRKKDPTLPKEDPRGWPIFWDETLWGMEPYIKWLYFSDEFGSYAKRKNFYYGAENSKIRAELLKKLDPSRLTKQQKQQSSVFFNTPELKKKLPKTFIELVSNKDKWSISIRYILAKFLDSID